MDPLAARSVNINSIIYFLKVLKDRALRLYSDASKMTEYDCRESFMNIDKKLNSLGSEIQTVGNLVIEQYGNAYKLQEDLIRHRNEIVLDFHEIRATVTDISALLENLCRQRIYGKQTIQCLN